MVQAPLLNHKSANYFPTFIRGPLLFITANNPVVTRKGICNTFFKLYSGEHCGCAHCFTQRYLGQHFFALERRKRQFFGAGRVGVKICREGHFGYHRYSTKLYVGSVLVSVMYGWSSVLGLNLHPTPPHICLIL